MKFEDALKKLDAESVGGQLIVQRNGKHILVGKNVQGTLIFESSDEAKAIAVELGIEAEISVETHVLTVDDSVDIVDKVEAPEPAPKKK
jgi:hypothetical protein